MCLLLVSHWDSEPEVGQAGTLSSCRVVSAKQTRPDGQKILPFVGP